MPVKRRHQVNGAVLQLQAKHLGTRQQVLFLFFFAAMLSTFFGLLHFIKFLAFMDIGVQSSLQVYPYNVRLQAGPIL